MVRWPIICSAEHAQRNGQRGNNRSMRFIRFISDDNYVAHAHC